MGRLAVLLLLTTATAILPAARADAYRLQSHRWYSRTLTYYDATGVYRSEVRAAARVLNRSGAKVRIRSASKRTARVRIVVRRRLVPAGQASYRVLGGVASRATVALRGDLAKNWTTAPATRAGITAVIAHELAHVLGLNHENRRCATMNSSLWARCAVPPAQWLYRCRILERDDVSGLVRRFGGRPRSVGPDLCPAEAAPAAPIGLAVTNDATTGLVRLLWTEGTVGLVRARILRRAGTCPTGPSDPEAEVIAQIESSAGRANSVDDYPATAASYCYAVLGVGALGRPGALATVSYTYAGLAPVAQFSWSYQTARRLAFADDSADRDGRIVKWSWTFGDGSISDAAVPVKTYAAAGTYTVTLTVTDDSGQTSTSTRTVPVT